VLAVGVALAVELLGAPAFASEVTAFAFNDEPIHPGCVDALVMQDGDAIPVTTAISLRGCKASNRSRAAISRNAEGLVSIEDPELIGGGSFGYRHLSTLKNGIFILGIVRTHADGSTRLSIAAVDLVERPMLLRGQVVQQPQLEMIGEVWIKDIEFASLRTIGNVVHFSAGVGPSRTQQSIDLSRIERARN
jgi:hypothetical protein